jgi:pimeloyl-ACP methyl ester carboxylesterase
MFGWKVLVSGLALSAYAGSTYRRDMQALAERQARESHIMATSLGDLEYAVTGNGPNVLISHSASGGYDQGLASARRFAGCRVIAPSRAGYLRTPLAVGRTPHAMAAAYSELLDGLGIERAVLVGWSAGAMSAIEFAVHFPDRCAGLILGGGVTRPLPSYVLDGLAKLALANRSDFLSWLIGKAATDVVLPVTERDAATREILAVFAAANPASKRRPGFDLDLGQMRRFSPRLEAISAPVLLIHGSRDFIVPLAHAKQAAASIPNATLLVIDGGQHDCPVRYPEIVVPAIERFLSSTAPIA